MDLALTEGGLRHSPDDLDLALEAPVRPADHLIRLRNGRDADEQVLETGDGLLGGHDVLHPAVGKGGDPARHSRPDHIRPGGKALGGKGQLHPFGCTEIT